MSTKKMSKAAEAKLFRLPTKGTGAINKKIGYKALDDLSREQKELVVRLMARISEASFRRGYQQGQERDDAVISGLDLRYGKHWVSLDRSKEPIQGWRVIPSVDRLDMEYGLQLSYLGLPVSEIAE